MNELQGITVMLLLTNCALILICWHLANIREAINRQTASMEQNPCPCNYPAEEA